MILNIDKILDAVNHPVYDPWEHFIVDDVLNYGFDFEKEFIFNTNMYFQLLGEINYYKDKITDTYKPVRMREDMGGVPLEHPITNTWGRVNWLIEPPKADKEIHMDGMNKLWTCIVYCFPENCNGTLLIADDGKTVVKEVEWKQNRALIFSPGNKNNKTWHKIINSTNNTRRAITINIQSDSSNMFLPHKHYSHLTF